MSLTAVLLPAALAASVAVLLVGPVRVGGVVPTPRWSRPRVVFLVAVVGVAAAVLLLSGRRLVLALVLVATAAGCRRLVRARQLARRREVAAQGVVEFCESVAAELAAGAPPLHALAEAVAEHPDLEPAATAARLGADVPDALRDLAGRPGCDDLRVVAAAWQVAHRSGGGLADPLARAAAAVRERRRTARVVAAELAPARATAQLMAVLPAVFLVAGSGLGGHPLRFLALTTPGLGCLAGGLLLSLTGLSWLQRIADRVEQAPP